jgi:protein involved in polysaccharide export with SLBB domain
MARRVAKTINQLILAGLVALLINPVPGALSASIKGRLEYSSEDYRLGPGDVLSVSVIPQEEYGAQNILIRSDGKASFPGMGDMSVADKTLDDVTRILQDNLSHWLKGASISVSLARPRPVTVYLSGAVMSPGSYQMITDQENNSYHTNDGKPISRLDTLLSNVLSNAGGVKPTADLANVEIRRASDQSVRKVDFWRFLKGEDSEGLDDLWINPGDRIHIPELPSAMSTSDDDYRLLLSSTIGPKTILIRVLGWVSKPDVVELDARSPLLSTAISRAGGYMPDASRKAVAVRRFSTENQFSTLFVDPTKMDFVLRPNDVVYIGENKFYKTGRFMQQASHILTPFQQAAQTGQGTAYTFGFGAGSRNVRF